MSLRWMVNTKFPAIGQGLRVLRLAPSIHNIPLVLALTRCQVWPDAKHYDKKTGRLFLPSYGLTVWLDGATGLLAEANGLIFPIESGQDLNTVQEVVVDEIYVSLKKFNSDKPLVIWDIGMNIGAASIWLALGESVVAVYAYEPFPHTYEVAQHSLSLNQDAAKKIFAYNFGVGGADEEVTADYSPLYKGSVSAGSGPKDLSKEFNLAPGQVQTLKLKIRSAASILKEIISKHPDAQILAKIDCEGAEYDIVSNLQSENLLQYIGAAEIECHGGRTDVINKQLLEGGFETTQIVVKQDDIDLIRAVRTAPASIPGIPHV